MQTSGDRVGTALKCRGWNWAELSRRSRVSITHLSRIRHGQIQRPEIATLQKLADAMGCDYQRLLPLD